ncbi:hypothetical protein K438DRAFT_1983325 [Mycena galopus ATCC 62051]|nr:hypothetical protein K438DRAFT_1983325 [Mycena galopus ATCC 62051]
MQFSLVVLLAIAVTVSGAPATAKALQVLVISKCVADLAPTDVYYSLLYFFPANFHGRCLCIRRLLKRFRSRLGCFMLNLCVGCRLEPAPCNGCIAKLGINGNFKLTSAKTIEGLF